MYNNLSEYIKHLESQNQLIRVKEYVSWDLEMTEIADRMSKTVGGGKAVLFENNGTEFPTLMNLWSGKKKVCMALGVDNLEDIGAEISELFKLITTAKPTLMSKLAMLPILGKVGRWLPKRVSKGSCQEVILRDDQVDLSKLPILKCWPHDGGRFITLPLVHTVDPVTGASNMGMYRMQELSKNTTAMHWHTHKTGARHYEKYKELGKMMPVSVSLGGDPIYTYAATAPMPDGIDEYLLAGFLRKKSVPLVKCVTNDLMVPEDSDFVLEGFIDPSQIKVLEGPFGDHTGFYSLEDFFPEFHITCITHRKNAIYPATIVGIPPQEDAYISEATESIFREPLRLVMQPEMVDLYMPTEGVSHNIAIVSIVKSYVGQAFKVASGLWGAGQMMFNKFLIITDNTTDTHSLEELATRVREMDIDRDTLFSKGVLDILDHTSQNQGVGGKLCIDLTEKLAEEGAYDDMDYYYVPQKFMLPKEFTEVSADLVEQWRVLLVKCDRSITDQVEMQKITKIFVEKNKIEGLKGLLIFDNIVELNNLSTLVWLVGSNVDPSRDVFIQNSMLVVDIRAKYDGINGFNRRWPNVLAMDPKVIETVDNRWIELGLGELIESPSKCYQSLVITDDAAV